VSGNVWNPDPTRQYPESPGAKKWRATPISSGKKKMDYSSLERSHPDDVLNQEYIDAGAAKDHERPLCFALHDGIPCRKLVVRGRRYCRKGNTG
jgi:hypothetical protein